MDTEGIKGGAQVSVVQQNRFELTQRSARGALDCRRPNGRLLRARRAFLERQRRSPIRCDEQSELCRR